MYSILIISALLGLATASPNPKDLDLNAIDGATFKQTGKRSGVNDDCSPQPNSMAPRPDEDTVSAFYAYAVFSNSARNAPTPKGYSQNFVNLQASSNADTYLGLYTLETYDTPKCSERCDAVDSCTAFNIYFERDPTLNPAAACPNPPSLTNIKCTLWVANVTTETATNYGQYRRDFHVVIAGSNGYSKPKPPNKAPGYTGPIFFPCAIQAPSSYLREQFFAGSYDAGLCATACNSTTEYNRQHAEGGSYTPCNFFNAYVLSKNGSPGEGTTCSLYSQAWNKTYATNCEQYLGSDKYTVNTSYGFTRSPLDSGHI